MVSFEDNASESPRGIVTSWNALDAEAHCRCDDDRDNKQVKHELVKAHITMAATTIWFCQDLGILRVMTWHR